MNSYIERVLDDLRLKDAGEPEFLQAAEEVLSSVGPVIEEHPEYEKAALLEKMLEPERTIEFRVPWVDDNGKTHVNRGFRVQFNGAIGPFKGGLRFAPSVNLSVMKFLGFEQTFKNSLTTLPMGGAKGGSDFDPNGKSDDEIRRFCQSFMTELYRHIGPDMDVPAGDLGVGGREIGYLFGQYRRIRGNFENGVLTGKGRSFGGSAIRPEATGYGAVYYLEAVLSHFGDSIKGKTVAVSGFGNVAWGVCKKLAAEGAIPVTISGPDGYIYDPVGIVTEEKIGYLLTMRASGRNRVQDYAEKFGVRFIPAKKPWEQKADIVMPCATQNDVDLSSAEKIVANGTKYYIEVANMPTTADALSYLSKQITVAPSKAVNAGGVLVSGLEMSQNSERLSWSEAEVDEKLHSIMQGIHDGSAQEAAKYGFGYDLVAGANIVAFKKVAEAMMEQGI